MPDLHFPCLCSFYGCRAFTVFDSSLEKNRRKRLISKNDLAASGTLFFAKLWYSKRNQAGLFDPKLFGRKRLISEIDLAASGLLVLLTVYGKLWFADETVNLKMPKNFSKKRLISNPLLSAFGSFVLFGSWGAHSLDQNRFFSPWKFFPKSLDEVIRVWMNGGFP